MATGIFPTLDNAALDSSAVGPAGEVGVAAVVGLVAVPHSGQNFIDPVKAAPHSEQKFATLHLT